MIQKLGSVGLTTAIAAFSISTSAAMAQDAETPADGAKATPEEINCELHVFPTLEGQAQTTGLLSGFGIVGAIADAAKNKDRNINEAEYLKQALGPEMQVASLKTIDLVEELQLPPSKIIFETPIADRKITTKAKTRLSSSEARCYFELLITQNFYKKTAFYGRSLNNRYVFKDFRDGKTETKLVKGRGGNGLKHFPPKTTDETEVAEDDLRVAFTKNFVEFSKKFKRKKRR